MFVKTGMDAGRGEAPYHAHPVRRRLARHRLRCVMTHAEIEHAIEFAGLYWFAAEYPRSEEEALAA